MNPTRCKKSAAQWSGDLAVWLRENSETNDLQMERLRRNLRRARQQELTSRQRQVVELYFDQGLNMTQIGCRLGGPPLHGLPHAPAGQRHGMRRALCYSF